MPSKNVPIADRAKQSCDLLMLPDKHHVDIATAKAGFGKYRPAMTNAYEEGPGKSLLSIDLVDLRRFWGRTDGTLAGFG